MMDGSSDILLNCQNSAPSAEHHGVTDGLPEIRSRNESLQAELGDLAASFREIQSRYRKKEEDLFNFQQQYDGILKQNIELSKAIDEMLVERDSLRKWFRDAEATFAKREEEILGEKEEIATKIEVYRGKIEELLEANCENSRVLSENLETVESVKKGLKRTIESLDEDPKPILNEECNENYHDIQLGGECPTFLKELKLVLKLVYMVENGLEKFKEERMKEKMELENSLISLAEENRDMNSLLRIALAEKEAAEKNLNRLKHENTETKRAPLLQIAERSLQRVIGIGFMMGSGTVETCLESSADGKSFKSNGNEDDEEPVSLVTTLETIVKNLRLEISHMRKSLQESRLNGERLQILSRKQAQELADKSLYIKILEEREIMLAQNVEVLRMEVKDTKEEIARWKKACEMEVEAGKKVVEERSELVKILKQELEKIRSALDISNGKLKLKDDLVSAAIAAQEAAERSLHLADSRAARMRQQIEELTRQLEESEKKERSHRKFVSRICWPWRVLKFNTARSMASGITGAGKLRPEMQPLLL